MLPLEGPAIAGTTAAGGFGLTDGTVKFKGFGADGTNGTAAFLIVQAEQVL
jgi:hypothetical protein